MTKRIRQYIGILAALAAYYLAHEGAHLLYALFTGVFRQVRFLGLGVQVDVYAERMTETQLGIFCLVGALAPCAPGIFWRPLPGASAAPEASCSARCCIIPPLRFSCWTPCISASCAACLAAGI